jgi:Fe-S-cluster containining protein
MEEKMKFVCLPGCGRCCYYKVYLRREDVEAINSTTKIKNFWVKDHSFGESFVGYLKKDQNVCIFLDRDYSTCSIYPKRPLYCRNYPFLEEVYSILQIDVDLTCPGLLYHNDLIWREIEKVGKEETDFPSDSSYSKTINLAKKIEGLLEKREKSSTDDLSSYIGIRLIEDVFNRQLKDGIYLLWSRINDSIPIIKNMGNIMKKSKGEELIDLLLKRDEFDINHRFEVEFLNSEFKHPFINTELIDSNVSLYKVRFDPENLLWHLSDKCVKYEDIREIEVKKNGKDLLLNYLKFWMNRQLLLRMANMYALSDFYGRNSLFFYLQYLGTILHRVFILTRVIAASQNKNKAGIDEVKEAIRGSDGFLRRRCQTQTDINELKDG